MDQERLEARIESLDLSEASPKELEKAVKAFSADAMALRKLRKAIRYRIYRVRTEALGGPPAKEKQAFKDLYEKQDGFDGWKKFSETWDVAMEDPQRVVHRYQSKLEEWEEVVAAKFPVILPGGKIKYPDKKVEEAVRLAPKSRKRK